MALMEKSLILVAHFDLEARGKLYEQVARLEWPENTELKAVDRYHATLLYSHERTQEGEDWLLEQVAKAPKFQASSGEFAVFSNAGDYELFPVVLKLNAPELTAFAENLLDQASAHGLKPSRFEGGFKAHITVAFSTDVPRGKIDPMDFEISHLGFW